LYRRVGDKFRLCYLALLAKLAASLRVVPTSDMSSGARGSTGGFERKA